MKLSYYPGCTAHSTSKEYTLSYCEVLTVLGVELEEIEDWNCCGAAAARNLNYMLSISLPARNIAIAQEKGRPWSFRGPAVLETSRERITPYEMTLKSRKRLNLL